MNPLLEEFKKFCEKHGGDPLLDDLLWFDMSIGWFLAKGASIEEAEINAVKARYDYEYWM